MLQWTGYKSVCLEYTLAIDPMSDSRVGILSVHKDKLAVAGVWSSQFHIYCTKLKRHVSSCTIPGELWDMAWTSGGNITCTLWKSNKVITVTPSGSVLSEIHLFNPELVSISSNQVIFIADKTNGVYSQVNKDNSVSWRKIFQPVGGWQCWQVIAVPKKHYDGQADHGDHGDHCNYNYWTLEQKDGERHVRIYSVSHSDLDNEELRYRDVLLPTTTLDDALHCNLAYCRLIYDGSDNIFLLSAESRCIYVWSLTGDYRYNLSIPIEINYPCGIAIDTEHNLLYIGHKAHGVNVLKIQ